MASPVIVESAAGYATKIIAGSHEITADEPESLGGTDTGMSPYELLLAALGSCVSITLRMYAKRKGWPLEGVEVRLEHDKIYARDCDTCETEKGKLDQIGLVIELRGPLDNEQRTRLMQIARMCPVHRTLHSEIHVETSMAAV